MKAIEKFLRELHTVTGNVEKYCHNAEYWPFLEGLRSEAVNGITLLNEQQKTQILNRINDISERLDKAAPIIRNHHKKARENQFSFDEFSEQVFWLFTGTPTPPQKDLIHYLSCWHNAISKKKAELKLFVNDVKKVFPEAELIKPDPINRDEIKPDKAEAIKELLKLVNYPQTQTAEQIIYSCIEKLQDESLSKKEYSTLYYLIFRHKTNGNEIFKPAVKYSKVKRLLDSIFDANSGTYKPNDLIPGLREIKIKYPWTDKL